VAEPVAEVAFLIESVKLSHTFVSDSAWVAAPVASAPGDPSERQNRRDYAIEGALDRHVIGPLARFYHGAPPASHPEK
jgi:ABC-type transporter lipoprotein component MlaA